MADADRPPLSWRLDDSGPDGDDGVSDELSDEWGLDDPTDEWTEPMSRAGTDPFDTPVRPARGQPERPADRRAHRAVSGARRAAGRPGVTGVKVGAAGGLATAVAVAASLALMAAPDDSREASEAPREPRSFPISELSEPAGFTPLEPSAPVAVDPLVLSEAGSASSAICELDPLAPAPSLPAADPAPAQPNAPDAGDDAVLKPDEPAAHEVPPDDRMMNAEDGGGQLGDPDDAGDRQGMPGSETRAP